MLEAVLYRDGPSALFVIKKATVFWSILVDCSITRFPGIEDAMSAEPSNHRLGQSAFVGRERELRELQAGLDEVCSGRGRFFLVTGEPGIGKSRLGR
jgi:predicted ATP-dependent serine protease